MSGLRVGSLFSGYGGLDLAVEAATGAQPAWFVEYDEAPSTILKHHWPEVPNYGDVTKVRWEDMPPVDILTGGTPCQDLSAAGKRAGMTEGTRSNLWVNMREAINIIRPQLVVWENVLGALSAKATSDSDMEPGSGPLGDGGGGHLRALGRVLGDLAEIGFDAEWTTLRASDIGAPHHRARVFLISWPRDSVLYPRHDAGRAELGKQHEVPAARVGEPGQGPADTGSIRRERGQGGQARRRVSPLRDETISATDRPAENAPDSESRGRDHGQATHDGTADRKVNAPGNDCDTAAHSNIVRSQAGHERPVGSGTEVTVTDGGGESIFPPRRRATPRAEPGQRGNRAGTAYGR